MIKKLQQKQENSLIISILAPSVILTIQFAIMTVLKLSETSTQMSIIKIISKSLMLIFFLPQILYVIRKNLKFAVVVTLITILIVLINLLLFENNTKYIKNNIINFIVLIVFFIYSNTINLASINNVFKKMSKISDIILLVAILMCIIIIIRDIKIASYTMSFGYYLLLPGLINLFYYYKETKTIYLIKFLMSFLMIIMIGSRGPIMCILIYIVLYKIFNREKISIRNIVIYTIIMFLFILIVLNAQFFLDLLLNICNGLGIYSRTLTLIVNKQFTYSSGRNEIYDLAFTFINNNPLFGGGLLADRVVLDGIYVHNIFLEIIMAFGIPLGTIIIISLLVLIMISLCSKNKQYVNLILIWVCVGFIPLFISGSIITSIEFWILFGFIFNKDKVMLIDYNKD